jgi:hypothetical protein
MSAKFLFASPEPRDSGIALPFKLRDYLREPLVLWGKKERLRQINSRAPRFSSQSGEDISDIDGHDGAGFVQVVHNLLGGAVRHPDLARTSVVVVPPNSAHREKVISRRVSFCVADGRDPLIEESQNNRRGRLST